MIPAPHEGVLCQYHMACLLLCRCGACQRCLDDFKQAISDIQAAPATTTPAQLGSLFRSACISKERPSAACDRAEKAISGSYKGNLARRVGGICRVLGECDAGLVGNSTCVLTAAGRQNGTLSDCLVDGVGSGPVIDGIWAGTGEQRRKPTVAECSMAAQSQHVLLHLRSILHVLKTPG
jgi:hypothetical protein